MHLALYGRKFSLNVENKIKKLFSILSRYNAKISCYSGLMPYLEENSLAGMIDGAVFSSCREIPASVDMLLSLGGDGTFLNALTMVRNSGIPVAGINFGRLGFLTSVQVGDDAAWNGLVSILKNEYSIEDKTLLQLSCNGLPEDFYRYALNEIYVQRQDPFMIGINVRIDGEPLPVYRADGLLVATSTGSTAYSLSMGGPVLVPEAGVFIISPLASHNLSVRPIIVPDTSKIEISILSDGHPVFLYADNRRTFVNESGTIAISKAPFSMKCVSLGHLNFFEALNKKLLWGADLRNESCF